MSQDSGQTLRDQDLRAALQADRVDLLEEALQAGLDPKGWLDLDSYDAFLTIAIESQSVGCVRLLLARDGDWCLEAAFDEDWTPPLAVAIESGTDEMLRLFVEAGVVDRYPVEWLRVALQTLPIRRPLDRATLDLLERAGQREEGLQALLDSPSVCRSLAQKAFLQSQAEKDQGIASRWSALAERLQKSDRSVEALVCEVQVLIHRGRYRRLEGFLGSLEPSSFAEVAGAALISLASRQEWKQVEGLISKGADCSIQDDSGQTALMLAAQASNLKAIRLLIDNGADVLARQKYSSQSSAIDFAQTRLIRRYLEKQATRQHRALLEELVGRCPSFVQHWSEIGVPGYGAESPLQTAPERALWEFARHTLELFQDSRHVELPAIISVLDELSRSAKTRGAVSELLRTIEADWSDQMCGGAEDFRAVFAACRIS